jgi:lipid-binding SYLF domain-containing protein
MQWGAEVSVSAACLILPPRRPLRWPDSGGLVSCPLLLLIHPPTKPPAPALEKVGWSDAYGGTGWNAPAAVRVEGGSFGFQIGASETDVVMLVMNQRGEDRLLSSQFTLGIALTEATLREDTADNQALYGRALTSRDILQGWVEPPADAQPYLAALTKHSPREVA